MCLRHFHLMNPQINNHYYFLDFISVKYFKTVINFQLSFYGIVNSSENLLFLLSFISFFILSIYLKELVSHAVSEGSIHTRYLQIRIPGPSLHTVSLPLCKISTSVVFQSTINVKKRCFLDHIW